MSAEIASLFVTLSSSVAGYNDPLRTAQGASAEFEAANKRMADAVVADNARIVESTSAMARATRADELSATVGAAPLAGVMGAGSLEGEAAAIRSSTAETDAAVAASSAGIREHVGEAARATGESEGLIGGAVGRTREHFGELLGVGEMLKPLAAITIGGFAFESVGHFSEVGQAAYELGEKFGIPKDKASDLLAAGQLVGVSTDSMSTGLKLLSRNLDTAARDMAAGKHPPAALAEALKSLDVPLTDAHGHIRDLNSLMPDLATAFAGMEDGPQKAAFAMALFGRSGTDMLPILNEGAAGLQQLEQQAISSGAALSGPQVDAAHKAYLAHQQLDAALTGVGNALGTVLAPALGAVAPALTSFSSWFSGPGIQGLQNFGGVVISDIGPPIQQFVGWVGGDLLPKLDHLWQSIQANVLPTLESLGQFFLQNVLPPMEAVAGFLTNTLLAGIQWVSDHFDALKPILIGVGTAFAIMAAEMAIGAVLDGLVTAFWAINGVLDVLAANPVILIFAALAAIAYEIYTHWDQVKQILGVVGGALLAFGDNVKDFLGNILGDIGGFFANVGSFFEGIGDGITHFFEDLPGRILGVLGDVGSTLLNAGKDLIDGLLNGISQHWADVVAWFVALPIRILATTVQANVWLIETGGKLLLGLITGIVSVIPSVVEFFAVTLPTTILGLVVSVDTWLTEAGIKLIRGLFDGVVSGAQVLWGFWTSLPGNLFRFFTGADTWLLNIGTSIIIGLWNGISGWLNSFWDRMLDIPHGLWQFFSNANTWLINAGEDIISGIIHGIGNMAGSLKNAVGDAVGGAIHDIPGVGGALSLIGHAAGGDVTGGVASIVGEKGPEIFIPSTSGTIIPNNLAFSGGGVPFGGGGGGTVLNIAPGAIVVNGSQDPVATAQAVRQELITWARQQGIRTLFGAYA